MCLIVPCQRKIHCWQIHEQEASNWRKQHVTPQSHKIICPQVNVTMLLAKKSSGVVLYNVFIIKMVLVQPTMPLRTWFVFPKHFLPFAQYQQITDKQQKIYLSLYYVVCCSSLSYIFIYIIIVLNPLQSLDVTALDLGSGIVFVV